MDLYLITGINIARATLEEAQQALREHYKTSDGLADLNFEEDGDGKWVAWNFSAKWSWDEEAPQIPETVVRVNFEFGDAPLPFDGVGSVHLELRVTTRDGVTSMEHRSGHVWDTMGVLGKGHFIEQFASRAGRALADRLTQGAKP
jgi:hypothetical protein